MPLSVPHAASDDPRDLPLTTSNLTPPGPPPTGPPSGALSREPLPFVRPASRPPPHPPATPGQVADYEGLYGLLWPPLVEMLSHKVGRDAAEDAAQLAFLKVFTNWSTVSPLGAAERRGYVFTAGRNAVTDDLRHRHAHPGGAPRSLESAFLCDVQSGAGRGMVGYEALLADPDPNHDPERVAVGREAYLDALAEHGGQEQGLRAIEFHLLARGYGPTEVAALLHQLALRLPQDPQARYYQQVTVSSIKMRYSRRRTSRRIRPYALRGRTSPVVRALPPPLLPDPLPPLSPLPCEGDAPDEQTAAS